MSLRKLMTVALAAGGTLLLGQVPKPPDDNAARVAAGEMPIFRTTVTARTAKAINYRHRSGATKIDFRGTSLLPGSRGEAKVESKQGYIEIEVEFDDLKPATQLGSEYLTYVMWAITPEGRTSNLGEVLLNGTKSKLNVTTELQVFGLVVTAEPYFAVTRPSDYIVMENVVRKDTVGKIEEIDAKYELLQRGQYQRLSNPLALKMDAKTPIELYEARNAVQIARAIGADRYASDTFQKAEKSLAQAEAYYSRKAGNKPISMTAREAVQTAEDARAIAVKRQEEEALNLERQRAAERQAAVEAQKAAAEAQRAAAQAETERIAREAAEAQARAKAEAERVALENSAREAAARAEAERLKRENEVRAAAAALETERLRLEAERQRIASEAQRAAAQAELERVAAEKARLEREKTELRAQLLAQFNAVLQTRDTARGLIVNMSDVLFDTGQFTLRPAAREKLARVAGIVSGHPGLRLDVEGHTDSIGSDELNQRLSERRSAAVFDYLVKQGVPASSLTSKGLGKTQPVASNDTAAGRQQNRRVELVVSGEVIGTAIGAAVRPN